MSNKTILHIGDLHAPVMHPDAYEFLKDMKKMLKPDIVVFSGDEIDGHHQSQWQKEGYAPGVEDELTMAIEQLKPIYKLFPEAKVCLSNHTFRYLKRAASVGLSSRMLKHIRDIIEAPKGWQWQQQWDIEDVLFEHGELLGGDLLKMVKHYRRNIAVGHAHSRSGIVYSNNGIITNFGLNSGCLIDANSYALKYAAGHADKPVLGCGAIIQGVPAFFPMNI